ncbi:necrosis inducing protein-domain-containing protein [Hypoxylon sp. FL1150]|nr:necrosis inducing protein-domain-containing protein [Hypoxylon sp. FL1150]
MHYASILAAAKIILLFGTLTTALPFSDELLDLYRDVLSKREPPKALPQVATADQLKWQPSLDFDKNGCYNTPAIDADGHVAEGLTHVYTGTASNCHDLSDLQNNNVYVRTRCNNGWCAYLYDYYFEKDVAIKHVQDIGGHRHDWEHIVVFVQHGELRVVAASQHGKFKTRSVDDHVRMDDGTHPKMVYHKNGGLTHCFRFAHEDDENVENDTGAWFRGALVDYNTGFPGSTRDILMAHDFKRATIAISDKSFEANLNYARNGMVPDFDSAVDE